MHERRNYARYLISGRVNLKFDNNDASILKLDLAEIGFIGFSILSPNKLELGQIVQFEIMPELMENSLTGKGEIKDIAQVREKDVLVYRIGIEFIDVEKDHILKLININQAKIAAETDKQHQQKPLDFGPF